MGICSSCLGGRRTSESDNSDASHLLGDQYQPNYGTASSTHNAPQPDPEELRRQRENLERICAETNEQLIPVSQPSALPEVTEQPSKNDEYAHLFNERFKSIRSQRPSSAGNDDDDETTWLENAMGNQGEDELEQIKPAKGKLTIQFGQR
ncbi:uncharacterized protein J4E87_008889 [Alternaria ethzedia]|uniref:uncharacterized protein n=1 Tax=Alternaria ethzedia TaxID=181014 RepID=UPI0020C44945|nr:uncharacterized protein J4E87_008889 [Alternaria ethzedia]XP_051288279.1 uncharacterized protein J4E90_007938 [Alternaria incomplexa]XP_051302010.1 uncharacterized protein J4E86_005904 [Alternaria arbusti]XP_051324853.1 uncharacterized protein J4E85_007547 [Alternaria conjuncta]KAI4620337.1 hypothetical protein J4E80_004863 [Alternaria sp. BMP 0032]KAI4616154.1 hypothetical protein J4E87_008889 [Alternaria ethzedia]KAI4909241.1 hypothetical protein J4E90_007938 [Alternaria incomplexa]KAI4